jgi:hypothetical protein
MAQLTLVSLYGPKPPALRSLIELCRRPLQASPAGALFQPYSLGQIHGTLVGMERLDGAGDPINVRFWRARGERLPMDLGALPAVLRRQLPMTVRFGGFDPDFDRFTSLGRTPYERSFQIQWNRGKVTLIGWPHADGDFSSRSLAEMRQELESRCRIRHKYDDDNDLFLVLGNLAPLDGLAQAEAGTLRRRAAEIEGIVRRRLAERPVDVVLDLSSNVRLARYDTEALDPESTRVTPLDDPRVDARFIAGLYEQDVAGGSV